MPRFSKQAVIQHLDVRIAYLEKTWGFHHQSGWNQVNGKGEEINRAYGEWDQCVNLRELIISGYITS